MIRCVCIMPASIRQTARKDVELGFRDIDDSVIRFSLDLDLVQLRSQFLELGLKLQNRLRKFLLLNLRRRLGSLPDLFNSFHRCYLRVLSRKDSNPFVKNGTRDGEDLADMRPAHPLFEIQVHRFLVIEIALVRMADKSHLFLAFASQLFSGKYYGYIYSYSF